MAHKLRWIEVQVTVVGHTGDARGSSSDHVLGFSGPVGVHGVALAPGTYSGSSHPR
jgi:hypothetical protein